MNNLPPLNQLFAAANADRAKKLAAFQSYQRRMASPNLKPTRDEPEGWPLTRPATVTEWSHILRLMIVRRVPESGPIHKDRLIGYVNEDLQAASDAGRIYVDQYFRYMRSVYAEFDRLVAKLKILKTAPRMKDPDMPFEAEAVYRTERTSIWLSRVPRVVQVVVDFLPTTSALDLMVQALIDAPDEPE